jgi:saccharopine dehydrogenase-like NADP-dependent oxidoreductase
MSSQLKSIAITGATGRLGSHIIDSVLSRDNGGQQTITALSRAAPKPGTLDSRVKVIEVDYNSPESITAALKGQDFLIITLATTAPQDLHARIVKAAVDAQVKYIMPNAYSYDFLDPRWHKEGDKGDLYSKGSYDKCVEIERLSKEKGGKTSWIALCCGYWYEWSLGMYTSLSHQPVRLSLR